MSTAANHRQSDVPTDATYLDTAELVVDDPAERPHLVHSLTVAKFDLQGHAHADAAAPLGRERLRRR
jgi:hypothetical protein